MVFGASEAWPVERSGQAVRRVEDGHATGAFGLLLWLVQSLHPPKLRCNLRGLGRLLQVWGEWGGGVAS